ncbi:MAG TPA: di-heme oxidoredictase family protein [Polyangiales bacterium]|nr:di-heme oxidoredictase family protein [Polyangiales bacterium]
MAVRESSGRVRTRFLHAGRASNVNEAILAHEGQGRAARNLYNLLPQALKRQLLAFIQTL